MGRVEVGIRMHPRYLGFLLDELREAEARARVYWSGQLKARRISPTEYAATLAESAIAREPVLDGLRDAVAANPNLPWERWLSEEVRSALARPEPAP